MPLPAGRATPLFTKDFHASSQLAVPARWRARDADRPSHIPSGLLRCEDEQHALEFFRAAGPVTLNVFLRWILATRLL